MAEGASYALRKRQIMRRIVPHLFEGHEILPIDDFAVQVMDALKEWMRRPEGRVRGVLLARGSGEGHYLDHASLARQMGVSIVQGSDLVVLDSRLYLKTIAGMDRVDVVLRRVPTSELDPVTFDGPRGWGVPGLLSCVRKGELAMANGMGSDLADNRALAAYLPAIVDYYLGEKPLLASPRLLELRDLDLREEVTANRDAYVVRHVWRRGPEHEWGLGSGVRRGGLLARVEEAPHEFVAHRAIESASFPAWTGEGAGSAPVTLRAFGLGENRISSCVLAWTGGGPAPAPALLQASDRVKDVWIVRARSAPSFSIFAPAEEAPKRLRLTSRVAEAFFWMGRYAERAEATARTLRVVQMQAASRTGGAMALERRPLWSAMAALSGHRPDALPDDGAAAADLPFYFLLDQSTAGRPSPRCGNGGRTRRTSASISRPRSGRSSTGFISRSRSTPTGPGPTRSARCWRTAPSTTKILVQLDELTGALEKHMLHNDAWHFWQLGVYAERALTTLVALREVVAPAGLDGTANLDLLLQMLPGSTPTGASTTPGRSRPGSGGSFCRTRFFPFRPLLPSPDAPRPLRHPGRQSGRGADTPLKHCGQMIARLNETDVAAYFPRRTETGAPLSDDGRSLRRSHARIFREAGAGDRRDPRIQRPDLGSLPQSPGGDPRARAVRPDELGVMKNFANPVILSLSKDQTRMVVRKMGNARATRRGRGHPPRGKGMRLILRQAQDDGM